MPCSSPVACGSRRRQPNAPLRRVVGGHDAALVLGAHHHPLDGRHAAAAPDLEARHRVREVGAQAAADRRQPREAQVDSACGGSTRTGDFDDAKTGNVDWRAQSLDCSPHMLPTPPPAAGSAGASCPRMTSGLVCSVRRADTVRVMRQPECPTKVWVWRLVAGCVQGREAVQAILLPQRPCCRRHA